MMLKTIGVARLTRDVEVRYSQSGSAIANFGIATSKKYKTQSGEQKEEVMFVDCTAFGRLAEICNQYLRKGSKVYIVGELKLDQWTAQDGTKRSKHSITLESLEMLDTKQDSGYGQPAPQQPQQPAPQQPQSNYAQPQNQQQPQQQAAFPQMEISEEEIPFAPISKRWM